MTTPTGFGLDESRPAAGPRLTVQRTAVGAVSDFAADYSVAFRLQDPLRDQWHDRSAERWLRSMFEDAPAPLRWFLVLGWTAITCRLRPRRSPEAVLGWQIEAASPDRAVIAVRARIGFTSRLRLALDDHGVTVGSFVTYTPPRRTAARAVWTLTRPLHERILPYLLRQAARRPSTPAGPG